METNVPRDKTRERQSQRGKMPGDNEEKEGKREIKCV